MATMETLVLNAGYEPVACVHWQRAVTMIFLGKVEVVESYDREVRAPSLALKVPAVVRFLRAIRRVKRIVKFNRENVYARDGGQCQYCGRAVARTEATYDHVVPRAHGGRTSWENVVIACVTCNQRKGGRTPEQAGMRLMKAPARPKHLVRPVRFTSPWNT